MPWPLAPPRRQIGVRTTPPWRETDSNHRSPAIATMVFVQTLRPDAFRERDLAPEARPTTARAEIASAESQNPTRPAETGAGRSKMRCHPIAAIAVLSASRDRE